MRSRARGALGLVLAVACGGTAPSGKTGGANVTLTITVSGQGSVSAPAHSITCAATCAQQLAEGTAVQLLATPASGMRFTGWSGACSGSGDCTLTLAQDTEVVATFAPPPPSTVLLTVDLVGAGDGHVTSSPAGIDCPGTCAMSISAGTPVTLSPEAAATSHFEGFGGGCTGLTCAFTASVDLIVYANFSPLAPDPCAGLIPKVPPAKTFVSPGNAIDGSCGSATTDGLGTVYNFDNANGGGIYSSAGGRIGGNLIAALASGVATFPRQMSPTGRFSVYAPDGTWVSTTADYYVPIAVGEQANGGSIVVSVHPATSCNDWEIVRFDEHFAKTSDVHFLNNGCTPGYGSYSRSSVLVDAQDRTLVVFVAQHGEGDVLGIPNSHYGARWFDAAGKPLTDWFDAGAASANSSFGLRPLCGGGAALNSGGDWVATFPSGAAQTGAPPAGFETGKDARIVLGGKAYAMVPFEVPATIDIVEPGGRSCGALMTATTFYNVGKDGTLVTLDNTVGPSGRLETCTATYYPQVLK